MEDKYIEALQQAQAELVKLEERRGALLNLIETLKVLSSDELYELTPPPDYVPEELTPEIRKILTISTVHLTATQIRDSLVARGFPHSNPKNLLISVHTAIGRIEDDLEIVKRDGKPAYKMRVKETAVDRYFAELAKAVASAHLTIPKIELPDLSGLAKLPTVTMAPANVKPIQAPSKKFLKGPKE